MASNGPVPPPVDIKEAADTRVNGEWIVDIRNGRTKAMKDWKVRLGKVDQLYQGNFKAVYPNEDYDVDTASVMNLIQVGIDDIARLVTEAMPSITVSPKSDTKKAKDKAYLQEAAVETYWDYNDANVIVPRLAMDLCGAGGAFVVADTFDGDYPCLSRVDPRYAYPDVYNGRLLDLLVVQSLQKRVAKMLFPRFAEQLNVAAHIADEVEVMEYYSAHECVQAISLTKKGKPVAGGQYIVKRWEPNIGMIPVGFAQLDTFDGEFRGMFDQIAGALNTKNTIVKLMIDYTDRITYAPKVSKGLLNPEVREGPDAHYRLDPNVQDAKMGRLEPAGPAPALFELLDRMEREQRGGTSYPSQRQGDVNQSIASASFVNSTMGQLTTTVRSLQRLLGILRQDLSVVCVELDKEHLDTEKSLCRSVGNVSTFVPSELFGEKKLRPKVNYGAGAGLDRMNADVRVMQHLGAGLISKQTAREQIDYLERDSDEQDRIEAETAAIALSQKFLVEAPWNLVAQVLEKMDAGISLAMAIKKVMEENPDAAQTPGAEGATAGAPGETPGTEGQAPMEEQLALQKGAGAGSQAPSMQKPQGIDLPKVPLSDIIVGG